MKMFISTCISCCAFSLGYFTHMALTHDVMIVSAIFAFCAWLAFWFIQLMEDDG